MKEFIIKIKWGGLGDHLLHSHLPRIAKQSGQYDKVYISNHSDYRSLEIKKFVWERNPFVDGFCNEDHSYPQFSEVEKGINILDKIMLSYDLDDDVRFHEAEIYYKPKVISSLKKAVIFDPNFITSVGHPSSKIVETYFERKNIVITHQMKLLGERNSLIKCDQEISSNSLEHFCDIINSCKDMYSFATGTVPLAEAINKSITVLFVKGALPMFYYSQLHKYVNITEILEEKNE